MSVCIEGKRRAENAVADLDEYPEVVEPTVIPPGQGEFRAWTVEAAVVDTGIHDGLLGILSEHGLSLHPRASQGTAERLVATA